MTPRKSLFNSTSNTKETTVSKLALVIPAEDKDKPLDQCRTLMMSRDICETDENFLQIIPYIVLVNEKGEYFSYERGSSGQEARLHAKRSIGLGGHIDNPVTTDIFDLIVQEAARELEEEVGLTVSYERLGSALLSTSTTLWDETSEVNRVHLGIAFELQVETWELTKLEDGVVINPLWLSGQDIVLRQSLKKLLSPESFGWEFETWSQMYLDEGYEDVKVALDFDDVDQS